MTDGVMLWNSKEYNNDNKDNFYTNSLGKKAFEPTNLSHQHAAIFFARSI